MPRVHEFEVLVDDGPLCINEHLPEEMLQHCLSFLDPNELCNVAVVCKKWQHAASQCDVRCDLLGVGFSCSVRVRVGVVSVCSPSVWI